MNRKKQYLCKYVQHNLKVKPSYFKEYSNVEIP
jgi:hypothetical protein